jgi:flagellar biogenesis protein FliO
MPISFWGAYLVKLIVLGALLMALYAVALWLKSGFGRGGRRHIDLIESTMLSPHAAVHLLRVGSSYLLVGGGAAGLSKLAEFTADELRRVETIPQST